MSQYFTINRKKVRVSDHEPNFSMDKFRGSNDIELYTKNVSGEALDVQAQIIRLFEREDINLDDLIEMYRQGLAKHTTLTTCGVKAPRKASKLDKYLSFIDNWFATPEENAEFLADLRKNPVRFAPTGVTAAQKAKWMKYLESKFHALEAKKNNS